MPLLWDYGEPKMSKMVWLSVVAGQTIDRLPQGPVWNTPADEDEEDCKDGTFVEIRLNINQLQSLARDRPLHQIVLRPKR